MTWIRFKNVCINSDSIVSIEKIGEYEISINTLTSSNGSYIALFARDENNRVIDDNRIVNIVSEIYEELLAIIIAGKVYYNISDKFEKRLAEENIVYYRLY